MHVTFIVASVTLGLIVASLAYAAPTSLLSASMGSGVSVIPVKGGMGGGGGGMGGSMGHRGGFFYRHGYGYGPPFLGNETYQDGTQTCVWNGYQYQCRDVFDDPNVVR